MALPKAAERGYASAAQLPAVHDDKSDFPSLGFICQKRTMRHEHYLIVAGLSLTASACLAALPFIAPQAALIPFMLANWTFFMMTGFMLKRRAKVSELTWKQSRSWARLFVSTLVAFMAAGWFAVFSGNPVA